MDSLPPCPECSSIHTYEDRSLFVCPECSHEWTAAEQDSAESRGELVYKDANGNVLQDGDTVVVIKDLKVKGSSLIVKGVLENYIMRSGTDYGSIEASHETKIKQIQKQLQAGEVKVVYDPNTESVTLMTSRDFQKNLNELSIS